MVNTKKTTNEANSQLLDSYRSKEESNDKIEKLEAEIKALKNMKSTNTVDKVAQFRLEKEQERSSQLEIQLRDKDLLSFPLFYNNNCIYIYVYIMYI